MTDFKPQSTDKNRQAGNPNVGYVLFGGEAQITSMTTTGGTGYVGHKAISLSALNLDLIIPDVDVWFIRDVALGGNLYTRHFEKLPYVELNSSMTIEKLAYFTVSFDYDSLKGISPTSGTTNLSIYYYDRSSSTAGQNFVYKIKSTRVQTSTDTTPF